MRAHQANSHKDKGWEKFTQKVIDIVAKRREKGVVFMAWGTPAKGRVKGVDREMNCVLEAVHPSPLSAAGGFVSRALFSIFLFPLRSWMWNHRSRSWGTI